jgi:hypothetical protein
MDTFLGLILIMIAFAVLAAAAATWGVDSREESPDPRRPSYPVGLG